MHDLPLRDPKREGRCRLQSSGLGCTRSVKGQSGRRAGYYQPQHGALCGETRGSGPSRIVWDENELTTNSGTSRVLTWGRIM
jgi:hypothetical protein